MEQPTTTETQPKQTEQVPVEPLEGDYNEGEEYYDEGYDEDDDDDEYDPDDTSGKYDLPVINAEMKKKKFKVKNQEKKEEDEEEMEIGLDGKKYPKFRGADKIYNQILWDEKFDKNEFIVAYEDRFEGILEEPFTVFETLKEDIPFHRIRYFKRNDEVVWDRKKKINKL